MTSSASGGSKDAHLGRLPTLESDVPDPGW